MHNSKKEPHLSNMEHFSVEVIYARKTENYEGRKIFRVSRNAYVAVFTGFANLSRYVKICVCKPNRKLFISPSLRASK
jgi:hypothetical protein